ncbi:hypothetical protein [Sporocytophaga sp.]|uniref:hypothetical protein n=1 Tax=Sporocytophaga sp. TaxID=2231183 RepID=UPI0025E74C15|nr:hypothetical protein [Sporocytophaga sp.]
MTLAEFKAFMGSYRKGYVLYIFLIICLTSLSTIGVCQDTIRKDNGEYQVGRFNKNKKRVRLWITYDSLGFIQAKSFYTTKYRRPKWIIEYHYSDDHILLETGKTELSGRYGKWRIYDDNGKLIKIEKYRFGDLHGTSKDLKEKKRTKYYFGRTKKELFNANGKRCVFYFTAGMTMFNEYSCVREKYACIVHPIAGCIVSREIIRRQMVHNFFVNIRQVPRFGFGWQDKFWGEPCK